MAKQDKQSDQTDNSTIEKIEDCFIITPIGAVNSDTFKKTTGLIKAIIEPVLKDFRLQPIPAHYINNQGSINKQIIKHIIEDKLVIANLTGLNPNVMYELAVRHAVKLPVITMAEHGTNLPFDIIDQRTIFYHDTLDGVEDCKPRLRSSIEAALSDETIVENPIYDVFKEASILKSTDPGSTDNYLISRLDRIESTINSFQIRSSTVTPKITRPIYSGKEISLDYNPSLSASSAFDEANKVLNSFSHLTGQYSVAIIDDYKLRIKFSNLDNDVLRTIINELRLSENFIVREPLI